MRTDRVRFLAGLAGVAWLACTSAAPPPEPSALRQEAQRAAEAGRSRFEARHWEASARSFERAAEIYAALDDVPSEAAALRNRAEALRQAGRLDDACAAFERALAIDGQSDRAVAQARDLAGLARCQSARGETDPAIATTEQALALADGSDPFRAVLENDLALYLLERGAPTDRDRVVALLSSALASSEARGDERGVAIAQLVLGRAFLRYGMYADAESRLRGALEGFRGLDDPEGIARTHEALARLLAARNEPERARLHREQARRGYEFLGDEAGLRRLDAAP